MGKSLMKTIVIALVISLFVTIGMVILNCQDDNQRRILNASRLDNNWNGKQVGTANRKEASIAHAPDSKALSVSAQHGLIRAMTLRNKTEIYRDRMERRRKRVSSECSGLPRQTPPAPHVLYDPKYKLYYCPVETVASTFWRRFMYQLHHTHPVRSPFDVSIPVALRGVYALHLPTHLRTKIALKEVLKESTKFLFVRDSYSRIFSVYVDKLLAPNPMFWELWGTAAILRYRTNDENVQKDSRCGYDVTFEEFVKYVIGFASKNNENVMPINRLCSVCAVNYTVIGNMESFLDDTELLFEYLNLNKTNLRIDAMRQETVLKSMADSATDTLSSTWLASSLKCITKEAVLQRIWRVNQIRGFVSWREDLKLSAIEIKHVNSKQFIWLLNEANKRSRNTDELEIQKLQAFREAFSTLNTNLINRIKSIYRDDFRIFGYNEQPTWLTDLQTGNDFINTRAFDYSQSWNLSNVLS